MKDRISKYFDLSLKNKPYTSKEEHIKDLSVLIDRHIEIYFDLYMDEDDNFQEKNISTQLSFLQNCWDYIQSRVSVNRNNAIFLPIDFIIQAFSLDDRDSFIFIVSIMNYVSVKYSKKYFKLNESIAEISSLSMENSKYLSLEMAINLYYLREDVANNIDYQTKFSNSYLQYLYYIQEDQSINSLNFPLKLSSNIISFIFGISSNSVYEIKYNKYIFGTEKIENVFFKNESLEIKKFIEFGNFSIPLVVQAKNGMGKKHILKYIINKRGGSLLIVDYKNMSKNIENLDRNIIYDFVQSYVIENSIIVIENFDKMTKGISYIIDEMKKNNIPLVLLCEQGVELADENVFKVCIPLPSILKSIQMWEHIIKDIRHEQIDLKWLCNRFKFTFLDIINIVKTSMLKSVVSGNTEPILLNHIVMNEAKEYFKSSLGSLVTHISADYTWDELIVSDNSKFLLKSACDMIKYKDVVYERYGLNRRVTYGKGLNILLKGPSGTGKTMAAQIIANELDMELYRVDLSQLVSKYIGETEKNIASIFDSTQNSSIVLFFDEMDALFSKRVQVSDSNDRNSNMEISFLLQKLESYEGICVMATNYYQNIDEAFLRRIQYVIDFGLPNATQRKQILKSLLNIDMTINDKFDYDILDKFDISGGQIKNIVVSALYFAASTGEELSNRHMVKAIKIELEKQGRIISKNEFDKYRIYF